MAEERKPESHAARRADAVANRNRLVQAARDAFAELGAAAEVKDIAERAGVGVGTIYRHFANKDELLHEVVVEAVNEFEREVEGCEALADPVEALRRHLAALLNITAHYGWLIDAVISGLLPEKTTEGLDDWNPDWHLVAVLQRGIDAGAFDPDIDLLVASNLLLGLTVAWKYGRMQESMAVGEAVEGTLAIFLDGVRRRP